MDLNALRGLDEHLPEDMMLEAADWTRAARFDHPHLLFGRIENGTYPRLGALADGAEDLVALRNALPSVIERICRLEDTVRELIGWTVPGPLPEDAVERARALLAEG